MATLTHNEPEDSAVAMRYSRYYEHDGMLRAYANRAMLLALLFGVLAMASLGFAIYVRLQPPTVVRVDANGDATVVGGIPGAGHTRGLTFSASSVDAGPSEVEAKAIVRRFLEHYLNYTPATVDKQVADALNMMTSNFRALVMNKLRDDDTIYKIQDGHVISNFIIRGIDVVKESPLTYTAFGVKEIHRLKNRQETTDHIVGRYNVRLVFDRRSEFNPSGLLVGDYWEQQMVGEKNTGLEQTDDLAREATSRQ